MRGLHGANDRSLSLESAYSKLAYRLHGEKARTTMKRTIKISELRSMNTESWSVKDNSVRGITTKYTDSIKIGDMVVIDNYFTEVTKE